MVENTPLESIFLESLRDKIHQLLQKACEDICNEGEIGESWDEEKFTQQLIKYMRKYNKEVVSGHFTINWGGKTISDRTVSASHSAHEVGKVDVKVKQTRREGGPIRYWIECKRVQESSPNLQRRYVTQGVARYVDTNLTDVHYAEEEADFGSMAGYVLDGEVDSIAQELQEILRNYSAETALNDDLTLEESLEDTHRYMTEHQETKGERVVLDHFLLDFTKSLASTEAN